MVGKNKKLENLRDWEILGRYFCIWRCLKTVQRRRCWENIAEVSLGRFYALAIVRIHEYFAYRDEFL
jgi:hypothetical protein